MEQKPSPPDSGHLSRANSHEGKDRVDKKQKKEKKHKKKDVKPTITDADVKARIQRYKLVQELLSSERKHLENLSTVLNNYLKPLREQEILTKADISELFCNIEVVWNWSKTFLEGLEEQLGDRLDGEFGEHFETMLPLLRQLYTQYSENYEQALATYERLKSSNRKFQGFLERKVEEGGRDLLSFLYLPIQRMLAYEALLKEILEVTPHAHHDYAHLTAALQQLREAAIHADTRAKQRKNLDKVVAIQNTLAGVSNLALPHRRFIYESEIALSSGQGRKERYLFLFNDILLCARSKDRDNKRKEAMEVSFLEPLDTLRLEEMEDTPELKHVFKLITPANEYIVASHSYSDKSTLVNLIRDAQRSKLKLNASSSASAANLPADEFSREMLVQRILAWSKKENAEQVLREVRETAAQLEKRRPGPGAS